MSSTSAAGELEHLYNNENVLEIFFSLARFSRLQLILLLCSMAWEICSSSEHSTSCLVGGLIFFFKILDYQSDVMSSMFC